MAISGLPILGFLRRPRPSSDDDPTPTMTREDNARVLTQYLWDESSPEWKVLADKLRELRIDPKSVAVGDRFPDDGDKDFGLLVTKAGEEC